MRRVFEVGEDKKVKFWNKYTSTTYELITNMDCSLQVSYDSPLARAGLRMRCYEGIDDIYFLYLMIFVFLFSRTGRRTQLSKKLSQIPNLTFVATHTESYVM